MSLRPAVCFVATVFLALSAGAQTPKLDDLLDLGSAYVHRFFTEDIAK